MKAADKAPAGSVDKPAMRSTRLAVRYVVGIDLGTTNTVVAYASSANSAANNIELFEIDQLMSPGQAGRATLLPSLRYHPAEGELGKSDLSLPWPRVAAEAPVTGTLARRLGAQVPGRLVASAKSWLSHAAVDRSAAILPWGAASDVEKVSPVDASASYLAHVRSAWNQRFPRHPLERQDIVLTVPASFDDGARELTLRAAREAGLDKLKLIEEPQAALYDWLYRHRATLAAELDGTRQILVCDVGGGTTDLSLIDVRLDHGEPVLTRTGVGSHLMLGGDNMDLVLAHLAESRMAAGRASGSADADVDAELGAATASSSKLSAGRLFQLMERCRVAKEQLLDPAGPEQVQVTLLGSGSKLVGSTRSATLTRTEVFAALVDGFFPVVDADARPAQRRTGLVEFGLPYASDGAITRHLAGFLSQHGASPDTLLLNGGVFRAEALSQRLQQTLAGWRGSALRLLHNDDPDVAVARGAVAYALAQHGLAPKIGGGSARSYFLILDEAGKAAGSNQRSAICVLPRGSEPGQEVLLQGRSFALRTGKPVRFHLVCSTQDGGQQAPAAGQIVQVGGEDFEPLPPVAAVMDQDGGIMGEITVQLSATLTELGTLELVCVASADNGQRWLLEFQLRHDGTDLPASVATTRRPPNLEAAIARIDRVFGPKQAPLPAREVRQLRLQLEALLGSRERWPGVVLRQLFDALWQRARGRRRSADHERLWLNLAGFCLRPGFGHTLDDWRVAQCWSLFENGVQHNADREVGSQWWTLWRRIAGGLEAEAQLRLLQDFAFNLQADAEAQADRPLTLVPGSADDMLRLAASLERIPGAYKAEIGTWMFGRIDALSKPTTASAPGSGSRSASTPASSKPELARLFWALGRLGARVPFYGSAHDVLDANTATFWLDKLLEWDWRKNEPAGFAAAHIARLSGDRLRDLPLVLRRQVMRRLGAMGARPAWITMVGEVVVLDEATERQVLGESLPPGLKLLA